MTSEEVYSSKDGITVGIIGGAGYTAGELIRLLLHHPGVANLEVQSNSHEGEPLYKAHPDLLGETEAKFVDGLSSNCALVFLCSGHGKSRDIFASGLIPTDAKVIDLSSDARWEYGSNRHMCCDKEFIYGLPELEKESIASASHVANPGCFATAIQLGLLPLASKQMLQSEVHVSAITGSTGAGAHPGATTHFSWRSNNASVYKAFTHQHLGEIKASIAHLQPEIPLIHFLPMRGAFTRGILATMYGSFGVSIEEARECFQEFYSQAPFVHISEEPVNVKSVVNTNKAYIHLEEHETKVLVTVVIDNLLKGASGQAVQNMNIMMGWDQTLGLKLKATAF
jgi:N-acetyl-gamma-glutamyl-phosphate reductase